MLRIQHLNRSHEMPAEPTHVMYGGSRAGRLIVWVEMAEGVYDEATGTMSAKVMATPFHFTGHVRFVRKGAPPPGYSPDVD